MKTSDILETSYTPTINEYTPDNYLQSQEEILNWLRNHNANNAQNKIKINSDWSVDISGHVSLMKCGGYIPVKFNRVSLIFSCTHEQLSSFQSFPAYSGGIYCTGNKISSFHNVHKVIKECSGTFDITNQHYIPAEFERINGVVQATRESSLGIIPTHILGIALIKGIKRIDFGYDKDGMYIAQLFKQHMGDILGLQQALIDAGFKNQAKL